jgi:hypothetical protein
VLVVSPDQKVTVGSFPGSAPINRSSFTHTVPASVLNGQGLTCQGTFSTHGTFVGSSVSGTLSSDSMQCNGIPVVLTGDYAATLQTAQIPRGQSDADLVELLRKAVRERIVQP